MAHERENAVPAENLLILDRTSDASSSRPRRSQSQSQSQIREASTLPTNATIPIPTPVEYVSLFEGITEPLKEDRDSLLDPYTAVLTGINQLLIEVAHYIKQQRDPPDLLPPPHVMIRLM